MQREEQHPGQPSTSRYAVIAAEQPVVNQGDPNDAKWIAAGGDPRDRGRFVELISGRLNGSERMLVGIAWLEPGDVHLLHHHPHGDEWYYVIEGSALFTVGDEVTRGVRGRHSSFRPGSRIASRTTAENDCTSPGASTARSWRTSGSSGMSDETVRDAEIVERAAAAGHG